MQSQLIKSREENGFTLAELLLAVAILAFALCAILATYLTCFNLTNISRNVNIATSAAQGLIERIRSTPFTQIVSDYDRLNFTVNNIPDSMGVVYVDDANPELLLVTVSVCWRQGNRIIGEDINLNGTLDAGEDTIIANNIIDSPVELITRVANR